MLRWWVVEMHVDGFRFDLASILNRGPEGAILGDPPVVELLAEDPVLAQTKIIAEPWDLSLGFGNGKAKYRQLFVLLAIGR